jgi:hypothetical protein
VEIPTLLHKIFDLEYVGTYFEYDCYKKLWVFQKQHLASKIIYLRINNENVNYRRPKITRAGDQASQIKL